jgi:hypothetical protein
MKDTIVVFTFANRVLSQGFVELHQMSRLNNIKIFLTVEPKFLIIWANYRFSSLVTAFSRLLIKIKNISPKKYDQLTTGAHV